MLSKKLEATINDQINAEIYSGYRYYSMATYFESLSLKGFAHWMRVQALEEFTHAQKFVNYINDRGGRVLMQAIECPPTDWDSPLALFEEVYTHEQHVTALINNLMDIALEEKDHASVNMLQWFVGEQVEEEASADEVVQMLKLVDNTKGGIFMLDKDMNSRTFAQPLDLAGLF